LVGNYGGKMKFFRLNIILLAVLFAFTTCGGKSSAENEGGQVNGKDVNLSNLTVSEGSLSPLFNPGKTAYNLELPDTCASINIRSVLSDLSARIEINNVPVNSGDNYNFTLSGNTATAAIKVIATDNTSKTYNIAITKVNISHNADLAGFDVSAGVLSPAFDANTINYSVTVAYSAKVSVYYTPAGVGAACEVIGTPDSDTVQVVVSAQDGVTKKTYTVVIHRNDAETNANLADLDLAAGTLAPVFMEDIISYNAQVENEIQSITVRPTAISSYATIKVNGDIVSSGDSSEPVDLLVGPNTLTVEVTAEDAATVKTYTVTVTRLSETGHNADLASLSLSQGTLTPSFSTSVTSYTVDVAKSLSYISVTPTVFGPGATVTVNGTAVVSGTASQEIALNPVSTEFTVVVTAEDRHTVKTYNLTVTRSIVSHNADLSGMIISDGDFQPAFETGITKYSVTTAVDVASVRITPVTSFNGATVKVNNVTVLSGTPSQLIALKSGIVVSIPVVVTAEDGTTTKTYTVDVKRLQLELVKSSEINNTLSAEWNSIASSSDGMKLAAAADWIYTSIDGGATWTERTSAGNKGWMSIASSSDGTKLAAVSGNSIYTSADSGSTWVERTSVGYAGWNTITSSEDGTRLFAADDAYIYRSTDSGVTWLRTASYRQWKSVSSSSDGMKVAAVPIEGYIYTSMDGGISWTECTTAGSKRWASISYSSDGTSIAAADGGSPYGYIYTSADGGVTWIQRTSAGSNKWKSITSSSNGSKIAAVMTYNDGFGNKYSLVYLSTNSGETWSSKYSNGIYLNSITSSSDGSRLAVTDWHGYIYTSQDSGSTWVERQNAGGIFFSSIASSYDGNSFAACGYSDSYIYTTENKGTTWIERTSSGKRNWGFIVSSSDCQKLAAYECYGYIYTSPDGGVTWIQRTSAGMKDWQSLASSSDGTRLAATAWDGYVYISADSGETWTERKPGGGSETDGYGAITSSADGTKLAVIYSIGGCIYTSQDCGETWIKRTSAGIRGWSNIISSTDGTRLIAVVGYVNAGYIYTSEDSGETWKERVSSGQKKWMSISSSSDCTKIIAVVSDGSIVISSDGGSTWSEHQSYKNWTDIAMSSDGSSFAVVCHSRFVFLSK